MIDEIMLHQIVALRDRYHYVHNDFTKYGEGKRYNSIVVKDQNDHKVIEIRKIKGFFWMFRTSSDFIFFTTISILVMSIFYFCIFAILGLAWLTFSILIPVLVNAYVAYRPTILIGKKLWPTKLSLSQASLINTLFNEVKKENINKVYQKRLNAAREKLNKEL